MSTEDYDVIVVGSGVSGLRAASELKRHFGIENIKVLEARDKIGGRVQQNKVFVPGMDIEVGAEFIHGDRNAVVEMAERYGWSRRQIFTWSHGDGGPARNAAPDGGEGYYWVRGADESKDLLLRYNDENPAFIACNEGLKAMADYSMEEAEADKRTLRDYLRSKSNITEEMLDMACAGYGNTAGGTADTVPASKAMRYERGWGMDGTELDPDFRMVPSFGVLINHLAEGLDIDLNSPVTKIEYSPAEELPLVVEPSKDNLDNLFYPPRDASRSNYPVTVHTATGRILRAHRVVVTIPLPMLQKRIITFEPPLPTAKLAAIDSLSFANGVKVLVKFSRRAWPANCHGVVCAGSFIPEMWMNSNRGVGGILNGSKCTYAINSDGTPEGIVTYDHADAEHEEIFTCTGFLMGTRANEVLAQHSSAVIIAKFLSQIERIFHMDAQSAMIDGFVHSWADEPYIGGAYSTPTNKELPGAALTLAEPVDGVIFFAGEATAGAIDGEVHDTVEHRAHYCPPIVLHGAMTTGSRAACEVSRSFGLNFSCLDDNNHPHNNFVPTYEGINNVKMERLIIQNKKSENPDGRVECCRIKDGSVKVAAL